MKNFFISLILIAMGIGLIIWGYIFFQKGSASKKWPTVPGKVISTSITKTRSTSGSSSKDKYSLNIKYGYQVDSVKYTGYRIGYGTKTYSARSTAQKALSEYSSGGSVTVYYDPQSPDIAVLKPGVSFAAYILFIMGAAMICAAVTVLKGNKKGAIPAPSE